MKRCDLSVVIPIYNEQENLNELHTRLVQALDPTALDYEIIFVNDCSRDKSLALMKEIVAQDSRFKLISLARNFGHQTAITTGMSYARGESVILMDGDLQDPPEVLPDLCRVKTEGKWDVVYAVRQKRKEHAAVRLMYFLFYRFLKIMASVEIPLDAGDFCIMSRRVVDQLNQLPERNRFVRGLRSWIGFRQAGFEYERAARFAGKTKYSFKTLLKLAFDGIFSFSYVPLRLSTYFGLLTSVAGILYAIIVIINRLTGRYSDIPGWTTVTVAILVMGGVQLMMLGLVGEYIGRIYEETKGRPLFIVDEVIGFDDPSN